MEHIYADYANTIFQSTRPIRGATAIDEIIQYDFIFQSTRPIRGATLFFIFDSPFQNIFQSTRPIRGATAPDDDKARNCEISIHAPHTGRDYRPKTLFNVLKIFQSTRPIRGATISHVTITLSRQKFQSTRPIRGATIAKADGIIAKSYFNPRAPYGARLASTAQSLFNHMISIHAPHTGRDQSQDYWHPGKDISIHAPHTGRDLKVGGNIISRILFQSTRPIRGATFVPESVYIRPDTISIHAPHTGRDATHLRRNPA